MNRLCSYLQYPLYLTERWQCRLNWYGLVLLVTVSSTLLVHLFLPAGLGWSQLLVHALHEGLGYCLAFALVDSWMHGLRPGFRELTVGKTWLLLFVGSQMGFFVLYAVGTLIPWLMPDSGNRAGLATSEIYWRLLPFNLIIIALWIEHLRQVTLWRADTTARQPFQPASSCASGTDDRPATLLLGGQDASVALDDLVAVRADENYCHLFVQNGSRVLHRVPLKKLLEELPDNFIQTHRSWVVSRDFVEVLNKSGRQGTIKMRAFNEPVPVSRARLDLVRETLK